MESAKKDDDTQWLVYWVVFAAFSVCEFFSDILVGWVPFYWFLKVRFINTLLIIFFQKLRKGLDTVESLSGGARGSIPKLGLF